MSNDKENLRLDSFITSNVRKIALNKKNIIKVKSNQSIQSNKYLCEST